MRAALLPTPGDPFMLAYWLRNLETWRAYVDEVVVLVNGGPEPEPVEGVRFVTVPYRVGHDGAINMLLDLTEADHIVLCEDDAYVRKPEALDQAFTWIEDGRVDIIGSPRHEDYFGSPKQEWPRVITDSPAELRRGLWPAFLFTTRAALTATSRVFGDRRWNVGDHVDGWRTVTREDAAFVGIAPDYIHLDTLFGTTFELRAKSPAIRLVHNVRLFDARAAEAWITDDPPWFHVTGLSTLDQLDWPLDALPDYGPGGGLWTRRLSWWRRVGIDIEPFLARADIDREELARWDARFDAWAGSAVLA